MKTRKAEVWLGVLLIVANFAIWAVDGTIFNFLAALVAGAVAIYLVWEESR